MKRRKEITEKKGEARIKMNIAGKLKPQILLLSWNCWTNMLWCENIQVYYLEMQNILEKKKTNMLRHGGL